MNILAVDDERLALSSLVDTIKEAVPDAVIYSFLKASKLLEFAKTTTCSVAFLDIQMGGMNGIELAKRLKDIAPEINIIFETGYSEYAVEAVKLRASGYLMKPTTVDQIKKEFENLRYPIKKLHNHKVRIQTFGNFEVFCNEVPIQFSRSKSKEILAYLVDRQGTSATYSEIASVLWEDGIYNRSRQKQLHNYICDLKKTFEAVGVEDIIIKNRKCIMIDKTKFDCDYYNFIIGDAEAVNAYNGKYMSAYSWAEFTVGYLDTHFN